MVELGPKVFPLKQRAHITNSLVCSCDMPEVSQAIHRHMPASRNCWISDPRDYRNPPPPVSSSSASKIACIPQITLLFREAIRGLGEPVTAGDVTVIEGSAVGSGAPTCCCRLSTRARSLQASSSGGGASRAASKSKCWSGPWPTLVALRQILLPKLIHVVNLSLTLPTSRNTAPDVVVFEGGVLVREAVQRSLHNGAIAWCRRSIFRLL